MNHIKELYIRFLKKFWNSKLKTKLVVVYIPVALIFMIGLCTITYRMSSSVLMEHVLYEADLKSRRIMDDVQAEVLDISRKITSLLAGNSTDNEFESIAELYDEVQALFGGMGNIQCSFYTADGRYVLSGAPTFAAEYYMKNPEVEAFYNSALAKDMLRPKRINNQVYVSLIHRIVPDSIGLNLCYMVTHINVSRFHDILKQYDDTIALLINEDGIILESTHSDFKTETLAESRSKMQNDRYGDYIVLDGERYYINAQMDPKYHWEVVTLIPFDVVEEQLMPTVGITGLVLFGYFFLTLLLFILVSGFVVIPLQRITLELGDKERKPYQLSNLQARYSDEIGQLLEAFDYREKQIEDFIQEISALERKRREAETNAFAAQMNPHLLYNTLATIIWLIEGDKKQEAVIATKSLATLLQDSLRQNADVVPIWKELETLRNYIAIQQLRYADRFRYIIYIDDDVMEYMIPRIVLQPIFENAIYHGIKLRSTIGLIKVTGRKEGNDIILQIADNGPADAVSIEKINQSLSSEDMTDLRIGVKNVHLRLRYRYGNQYGLSYEKRGEFTITTIRFPAEKGEEDV